ncbi:MAG: hypothetical protein D3904_06585 [Candidatus Electrothrix sp. EH2]|nr:hypothetical protein [Candidatus Electrothrix sp. EH2]
MLTDAEKRDSAEAVIRIDRFRQVFDTKERMKKQSRDILLCFNSSFGREEDMSRNPRASAS